MRRSDGLNAEWHHARQLRVASPGLVSAVMSQHGASQDRSDEAPVEREVDPPPAEIPSSGGDKATAEQDTQKRERGEDSEPDATEKETSPPEPKRRMPAPNEPLFSRSRDARRLLGDGTPADAYRDLDMAAWSQAQMRSHATRSRSGSRSGPGSDSES